MNFYRSILTSILNEYFTYIKCNLKTTWKTYNIKKITCARDLMKKYINVCYLNRFEAKYSIRGKCIENWCQRSK